MKIAACLWPRIQAQIPKDLCIVFECRDRLVSCKIHLQSFLVGVLGPSELLYVLSGSGYRHLTLLQEGLGSLLEPNHSNNKDFDSEQGRVAPLLSLMVSVNIKDMQAQQRKKSYQQYADTEVFIAVKIPHPCRDFWLKDNVFVLSSKILSLLFDFFCSKRNRLLHILCKWKGSHWKNVYCYLFLLNRKSLWGPSFQSRDCQKASTVNTEGVWCITFISISYWSQGRRSKLHWMDSAVPEHRLSILELIRYLSFANLVHKCSNTLLKGGYSRWLRVPLEKIKSTISSRKICTVRKITDLKTFQLSFWKQDHTSKCYYLLVVIFKSSGIFKSSRLFPSKSLRRINHPSVSWIVI